jgi:CheY-like chemotaxis protein
MANPRPPKVLFVDDNKALSQIYVEVAEFWGWDARMAVSGEEALGLLDSSFDAAVIDHQMDGMDGIEVLEKIRSRTALERVAVLIVTGSQGQSVAIKAFRHDADDFVTKLVEFAELQRRILAAIAKRKRAVEISLSFSLSFKGR